MLFANGEYSSDFPVVDTASMVERSAGQKITKISGRATIDGSAFTAMACGEDHSSTIREGSVSPAYRRLSGLFEGPAQQQH